MNRRHSLGAIAALIAGSCSRGAWAQPAGGMRRIGYLGLENEPKTPVAERGLAKALAPLGWLEGKNLVVERAFAELKVERLKGMAEDLVRKRVEVIMTSGPYATLAAARATRSIPIVFFSVVWPIEQGFIDSFSRPGRNLTGAAWYSGVEVTNKRLEFLRQIAPSPRRLSWFWPPEFAETVDGSMFDMASVMQKAAAELGFETRFHNVSKTDDVERALADAATWRAQALTASGPHVTAAGRRIADVMVQHKIPSAFSQADNVETGGLLSYAPQPAEAFRMFLRGVESVDRILRGAKPSDLPVERPDRYELTVNAKTAKALGITIPQSILIRADRVIE
jgi:putative ABC transport system substrate-binding protein